MERDNIFAIVVGGFAGSMLGIILAVVIFLNLSIGTNGKTRYCTINLEDGTQVSGKVQNYNLQYGGIMSVTVDGTTYTVNSSNVDMIVK
jgi:hypothetical protein